MIWEVNAVAVKGSTVLASTPFRKQPPLLFKRIATLQPSVFLQAVKHAWSSAVSATVVRVGPGTSVSVRNSPQGAAACNPLLFRTLKQKLSAPRRLRHSSLPTRCCRVQHTTHSVIRHLNKPPPRKTLLLDDHAIVLPTQRCCMQLLCVVLSDACVRHCALHQCVVNEHCVLH